jgi:hypothetical protein
MDELEDVATEIAPAAGLRVTGSDGGDGQFFWDLGE